MVVCTLAWARHRTAAAAIGWSLAVKRRQAAAGYCASRVPLLPCGMGGRRPWLLMCAMPATRRSLRPHGALLHRSSHWQSSRHDSFDDQRARDMRFDCDVHYVVVLLTTHMQLVYLSSLRDDAHRSSAATQGHACCCCVLVAVGAQRGSVFSVAARRSSGRNSRCSAACWIAS